MIEGNAHGAHDFVGGERKGKEEEEPKKAAHGRSTALRAAG